MFFFYKKKSMGNYFSFLSSSSSSSLPPKRYVSFAAFNLDASNKIKQELNDHETLFNCINTIIERNFERPDIITFTEVVSTKWIDMFFEKRTNYWGVSVSFENHRLKIYTAWNKELFKCLRIIRCRDGRYVCFLLQHLVYNIQIWYVSIHAHKKKVDMRHNALKNLMKLGLDLKNTVVIVSGDFNDTPAALQASTSPHKHVNIAITSKEIHTTQRKKSIDNSILFNATYTDVIVDDTVKDFSHYPIRYSISLD